MMDVSEYRQFAAELRTASGRVGGRAAQALRKTASDITRDAKINAPVDIGNLRRSIGWESTGDGRQGRMSIEIGPTVNYGKFVELGTSKMAAQPYLFPATDRHVPGLAIALSQIVSEAL